MGQVPVETVGKTTEYRYVTVAAQHCGPGWEGYSAWET